MSHTKKRLLKKRKTAKRCKSCGKLFNLKGGWQLKSVKSHTNRTRSKSRSKNV